VKNKVGLEFWFLKAVQTIQSFQADHGKCPQTAPSTVQGQSPWKGGPLKRWSGGEAETLLGFGRSM